MNDKERDRSGDGAGPSPSDDAGPYRWVRKIGLFTLLAVCATLSLRAQTARGLSITIDAGTLFADNYQAGFYSGIPSNLNSVERIMHSQQFGSQMWSDLASQGLINMDVVGNYSQLTVAEYGQMHYRLAMQIGVALHYDFGHNWAWLLRFDYAKLTAVGQFLLNSGFSNSVIVTNQDAYVACPIMGTEKRINIDLGISRRFDINERLYLSADLGGSLINTKVLSNSIQVAGNAYSILDVWGGQSPDAGMQPYEYLNQGGIGYGGFFTIALGFALGGGNNALLHYTIYYTQTHLPDYTTFNPHNLNGLKFQLGNFSFFRN